MSFAWFEIHVSLNVKSVGFIHVVAYVSGSFFFFSYLFHLYHNLFTLFTVDRHFGYFYLGAIMDKAAVNIFLHIFWWT